MRKIIEYLYKKFCYQEDETFKLKKIELTKDQKKELKNNCSLMVKNGSLELIVDILVSQSETRQLYKKSNTPIQTTEAELEKVFRDGVNGVIMMVKRMGNVSEDTKEFDRHAAL